MSAISRYSGCSHTHSGLVVICCRRSSGDAGGAKWRSVSSSAPSTVCKVPLASRSCPSHGRSAATLDPLCALGELTDVTQGYVRRRVSRYFACIQRVMPLPWENRGEPFAPESPHGCEDAQLVVHHHVVDGRIAPLDGGQHLFLVQVDENPSRHRIPQAGALHLTGLEHHVAVRQDHGFTQLAAACQCGERTRIKARRKRVVHQEG